MSKVCVAGLSGRSDADVDYTLVAGTMLVNAEINDEGCLRKAIVFRTARRLIHETMYHNNA